VTTIIKNKRRTVAAKRAAEKAAKTAANEARKVARARDRQGRGDVATNSKFQIPNC
jgi:hypothetical protein